jgi:hypothetical protein
MSIVSAVDQGGNYSDMHGVSLMVYFYYGKVAAEAPGFDLSAAVASVTRLPNYMHKTWRADLVRCMSEFNRDSKGFAAVDAVLKSADK